ncbi:hypothetical protein AXK11_06880 [Cephaloticoccus primus]|uniref:DUF805 domain-containing protein n=1 Tax=Cephaloticoccus primus TaxID=1548207 RepID=A0A139SKR7_9BACT|nr:DUF805 domain-containing protein [Cephaloticoccus primus]KXU35074.1 hypothetical protein AXK11_06880 [Cephaloticoccus primus]
MFKWMFLPLKNYAGFSGRSRRKEFWWWFLFTFTIGAGLFFPVFWMFNKAAPKVLFSPEIAEMMEEGIFIGPLEMLYRIIEATPTVPFLTFFALANLWSLATFVPHMALSVRRFHDCNLSGWLFLGLFCAGFIPFFGVAAMVAIFIIVGFIPSTPGANRFGERAIEPGSPNAPLPPQPSQDSPPEVKPW